MEARENFKNMANLKRVISKVIFKVIITILCVTQFSLAKAQEITEENYRKVDNAIWSQLEQEFKLFRINHNKKVYAIAEQKNVEAAIKYASVPSGLQRLFMLRLSVPKDTISNILKTLPDNMQSSPYAKSLLYHVETEQIAEGSKYYNFQATDTEGKNFTLSSLEGKNILLLYGGLNCLREKGRSNLHKVYKKTEHIRNNFEIVVFCERSSDLEHLKQEQTKYHQSLPFDYFLVSDYLKDHSPVKILYGAQATPTCFLINPNGIVVMKTIGLDRRRVNKLLKEQKK